MHTLTAETLTCLVVAPGKFNAPHTACVACLSRRLGHNTAHFNVGNYRRLQKEANEIQNAEFFDSHNQVWGTCVDTYVDAC